jgi:ornithine cyclodeaminase/alanine dehydrogenase-like protein (mu-crystallin family)
MPHSTKMLVLDADDVYAVCSMRACVNEMARSFALQGRGSVQCPMRTKLSTATGDVLVMPSLITRGGGRVEGSVKTVSVFPHNKGKTPSISAAVLLFDGRTGEMRAMIEGRSLTAIRTGAVSGLSCRFLASRSSRTLGIIGAGGQAFQQVSGVLAELPGLERIRIFSRHGAKSKLLARECAERFRSTEAVVEGSAAGCVKGSDVVVTATTSTTPVFDGAEVEPGAHVIAIGAYRPDSRELDSSLVSRASVFVDSRGAALEEAGDLLIPIGEGRLRADAIKAELSELVLGKKKGRTSDSEVTVFKSVGLAFEDNAAGWLAYRAAMKRGAGGWSGGRPDG